MTPTIALALALSLATANEIAVETIFGIPFQKIERLKPHSWLLYYVALVSGFVVNYLCGINILSSVSTIPPDVGLVLTSILVGGGSTLLHRIFPDSLGGDKNVYARLTAGSVELQKGLSGYQTGLTPGTPLDPDLGSRPELRPRYPDRG